MTEKVQNNDTRRDLNRVDRGNFDRGGRLVAPGRPVEKSPFEKVLDQTTQRHDPFFGNLHNPQATETATREAVRAVAPQKEKPRSKEEFKKKFDEKETDQDERKSSRSRSSDAPQAKVAEKRVIARSAVSDQRHQGSGGDKGGSAGGKGSFGQNQQGKGDRRGDKGFVPMAPEVEAGGLRAEVNESVRSPFVLEAQMARVAATSIPRPLRPELLNKALIDRLVQYCRLVTKVDGDKEIDMQLHEEVFKGLRLRLALVKGKVATTFVTRSPEVRDLFLAQKGAIQQALEEKGIEVASVEVTMV